MVLGTGRKSRRSTRSRSFKSAKLKQTLGVMSSREYIRCSMLNVDSLNEYTLHEVRRCLHSNPVDLFFLLETKRRKEEEESGINIDVEGYEKFEFNRSDMAGDKAGGGIALYTSKSNGLIFHEHHPVIADPAHLFVEKERVWRTVDTLHGKTAFCAVYAGFQAGDDRHGQWNDILFSVLQSEIHDLRSKGFRVVLLGDFNSHVGCVPGIGIENNNPDVNKNGKRFLKFLDETNCVHVNGIKQVTSGLWTWQKNGTSSVVDYCVVGAEHLSTVKSMTIDDQGLYSGCSDHNWMFVTLKDLFRRKHIKTRKTNPKKSWNIHSNLNWNAFKSMVSNLCSTIDVNLDSQTLADNMRQLLQDAGMTTIGYRSDHGHRSMKSTSLPWHIVKELEYKRQLAKNWISKSANFHNLPTAERSAEALASLKESERLFLEQKQRVTNLFFERRQYHKAKVLQDCSGNSAEARRKFWSYVSSSTKSSNQIDSVISSSGEVLNSPEDICSEVEKHLLKVFNGSFSPIESTESPVTQDHPYAFKPPDYNSDPPDHSYHTNPFPRVVSIDSSKSLNRDPKGWLDRDFSMSEIQKAIKSLKSGKAVGLDNLPNEFIINAGDKFAELLVVLFNKVKQSGSFPSSWNRGRVSLVHKKGPREVLGNYRPLTVINSISGLYSRLLNERLRAVVEKFNLLGEIQNGFRKNRNASDNSFILKSILWREKAMKRKVHLAFIDLVKAYDMVDRNILWSKLSSFGFGGEFLASLKAIYSDDSIQAMVNNVTTRPIFLGRGLRQGCSLSPLLFALYIAEMGQAIHKSAEGFTVQNVIVSGLFFADDLSLLARTPEGLIRLLSLVYDHAKRLKMEINTSKDKSEVISPVGTEGDEWQVKDATGNLVLTLNQVVKYKYLGCPTMESMHKTSLEHQKQCVSKAYKYKGSCIYISKEGPDVVQMVLATWRNIALPSILYGTEMIPFSETTILEIEKVQNQVAKFALGVSIGCAGICAQLDLGMKPFRQVLYEHQLKFYLRVLRLPDSWWVRQALEEHLSCKWNSPYLTYIRDIRNLMGIHELPMREKVLVSCINEFFVKDTNNRLALHELPWLNPIKVFKMQSYVSEGKASACIAKFRYDVAGIGKKYPRHGQVSTRKYCPICPFRVENSVQHVAFFCSSVENVRKNDTELRFFRNICQLKGFSEEYTFSLYINGQDWNENFVDPEVFINRGTELQLVLDAWLSKW